MILQYPDTLEEVHYYALACPKKFRLNAFNRDTSSKTQRNGLRFGKKFSPGTVAGKIKQCRAERANTRQPSAIAVLLGVSWERCAKRKTNKNIQSKRDGTKAPQADARRAREKAEHERGTQQYVEFYKECRIATILKARWRLPPILYEASVAIHKLRLKPSARTLVPFWV